MFKFYKGVSSTLSIIGKHFKSSSCSSSSIIQSFQIEFIVPEELLSSETSVLTRNVCSERIVILQIEFKSI